MSVTLIGYRYSVYSWIARLVLTEKGVDYDWQEIDPFVTDVPARFLALNPFKRVPVLLQGDLSLYETVAITRYVDEAFEGPSLQPDNPVNRARQSQILSIIDSDAYWPLVRQVFAQGFFAPQFGETVDQEELAAGLGAAPAIVQAPAVLKTGQGWILGPTLTLADIHLYPILAYFAMVPEGAEILGQFPSLELWRQNMAARPSVLATHPKF
ncbi:MAG: glutathione S-transferase family protein [Alphaproteobacteria bacterium]|nr:glutathione S-transferase family protein [Alphaproteobacteria bacterium]